MSRREILIAAWEIEPGKWYRDPEHECFFRILVGLTHVELIDDWLYRGLVDDVRVGSERGLILDVEESTFENVAPEVLAEAKSQAVQLDQRVTIHFHMASRMHR